MRSINFLAFLLGFTASAAIVLTSYQPPAGARSAVHPLSVRNSAIAQRVVQAQPTPLPQPLSRLSSESSLRP